MDPGKAILAFVRTSVTGRIDRRLRRIGRPNFASAGRSESPEGDD